MISSELLTRFSELLLTFVLNAVWQLALIAALASCGAWLLRHASTRYQHGLWVAALCLSLLVPAATAIRAWPGSFITANEVSYSRELDPSLSIPKIPLPLGETPATTSNSAFHLNTELALGLLALFAAIVLFRTVRLGQACHSTRKIRRSAVQLDGDEAIEAIVRECAKRVDSRTRSISNVSKVTVCRSESLAVPVTIGLLRPVIILPDSLLETADNDLLTSAIGHEFIHVARHDYLLNFLYELLFLPVSFHPAAALGRRRIKQTRELVCDELVAERILNAQVYARSLVALASSAPPLRPLSVTTTVGIADADILEARIMSLLSKPKLKKRWKKLLLVVVSLLLLIPSLAAAAFAMHFELATNVQDPAQQEKETVEKRKLEVGEREERTAREARERMEQDPRYREEVQRKEELEMQMRAVRQAALLKLARINMDQAIQIATSQTPGKVLECNLTAEKWEEPGKLAKDGVVFYHVMIADETTPGSATHVWVNAVDGSIIKTEKEIPRRRNPENN
jgi:beta-lactamase regulating signal transducer with metallopeptidase domain